MKKQVFGIIALLSVIVLVFQNCGNGFEKLSLEPEARADSSTTSESINQINVTGIPTDVSNDSRLTIEFELQEPNPDVNFQCYFDGTQIPFCKSPIDISPIEDGDHTLEIRPSDSSITTFEGNWSTILPNLSLLVNPPPAFSPLNDLAISYSVNSKLEVEYQTTCTLDDVELANCMSPIILEDLPEGAHNIVLNLIYEDEIVDTKTIAWTIDTSYFNLTLLNGPGVVNGEEDPVGPNTNNPSPSFQFEFKDNDGNDRSVTFECSLSRRVDTEYLEIMAQQACDFPTHTFGPLNNGRYQARFYAQDEFDRVVQLSYGFTVDRAVITNFEALVNNNFRTHHRAVIFPIKGQLVAENYLQDDLYYQIEGVHPNFVKHSETIYRDDRGTFIVVNNLAPGAYKLNLKFEDILGNASPVRSVNFTITTNQELVETFNADYFYPSSINQVYDALPSLVLRNQSNILVFSKNLTGTVSLGDFGVIQTTPPYWTTDQDPNFYSYYPLNINSYMRAVYSNTQYAVFFSDSYLMTLDILNPTSPKLVSLRYVEGWKDMYPVGDRVLLFGPTPVGGDSEIPAIYSVSFANPLNPSISYHGQSLDFRVNGLSNYSPSYTFNRDGDFLTLRVTPRDAANVRHYIVQTYAVNAAFRFSRLASMSISENEGQYRVYGIDQDRVFIRSYDVDPTTDSQLHVHNVTSLAQGQSLYNECDWQWTFEVMSQGKIMCNKVASFIYRHNGTNYVLEHTVATDQGVIAESNTEIIKVSQGSEANGIPKHLKYFREVGGTFQEIFSFEY